MAVSPSPPVSPTGLLHRLSKLQIDAPSIVDQESGEVGSQNGGRWRKTSARWNRMGSTCGSGISLCSCSTSWPLSSTAPPPCGQGSGSAPSRVSSNSGGTTRDAERPSQAPALRPGVWGLAFGVRRENGAASRFPLPGTQRFFHGPLPPLDVLLAPLDFLWKLLVLLLPTGDLFGVCFLPHVPAYRAASVRRRYPNRTRAAASSCR